jgi:hypothetical protein
MNFDEMTPEQLDYEATYIAEGIDALEKHTGLELSDESLDEVIDTMRANRGEDGAPLVEDVFNQFVADAEAEGTIEAADEAEDEALEEFEAEPTNEPSAVQFAAMQRGDYGPELQRQALEAVGINTEEPEGEQPNDWAGEFQAQQIKLEKRLNRGQTAAEKAEGKPTLTSKELDALIEDTSGSDQPLDLDASYESLFGRKSRHGDDRHDLLVQAFEDSENEGKDDETYAEEWQEPKELDLTNDEDRQAAMSAAMEEAEA